MSEQKASLYPAIRLIRLPQHMDDSLVATARSKDTSTSQAVRTAIKFWLEHGAPLMGEWKSHE